MVDKHDPCPCGCGNLADECSSGYGALAVLGWAPRELPSPNKPAGRQQ